MIVSTQVAIYPSDRSLHTLASTSAAGRLRRLLWAYSLFPGNRPTVAQRIPFGDVIRDWHALEA